MYNYIREMFTDLKYRDRWVMISLPNETENFPGHIKGFFNDDTFSLSRSMDTGDENIDKFQDMLSGAKGLEGVGEVTSKSFSDVITYNGANNQSISFNLTIIPEISQKMGVEEFEEYLAKLILPKPYNISTKFLGVSNYDSYIKQLSLGASFIDTLKKAGNAIGVSKHENTLDKGLTHIYFGDNIRLTGMVITEASTTATVVRTPDGQFYSYELSVTAVPHRLLDAVTYAKSITNKSNSKLIAETT